MGKLFRLSLGLALAIGTVVACDSAGNVDGVAIATIAAQHGVIQVTPTAEVSLDTVEPSPTNTPYLPTPKPPLSTPTPVLDVSLASDIPPEVFNRFVDSLYSMCSTMPEFSKLGLIKSFQVKERGSTEISLDPGTYFVKLQTNSRDTSKAVITNQTTRHAEVVITNKDDSPNFTKAFCLEEPTVVTLFAEGQDILVSVVGETIRSDIGISNAVARHYYDVTCFNQIVSPLNRYPVEDRPSIDQWSLIKHIMGKSSLTEETFILRVDQPLFVLLHTDGRSSGNVTVAINGRISSSLIHYPSAQTSLAYLELCPSFNDRVDQLSVQVNKEGQIQWEIFVIKRGELQNPATFVP